MSKDTLTEKANIFKYSILIHIWQNYFSISLGNSMTNGQQAFDWKNEDLVARRIDVKACLNMLKINKASMCWKP